MSLSNALDPNKTAQNSILQTMEQVNKENLSNKGRKSPDIAEMTKLVPARRKPSSSIGQSRMSNTMPNSPKDNSAQNSGGSLYNRSGNS